MQAVLYQDTWATEPGCRRYEFFRGPERGEYYALLSFDDFQAFLVHQSSDHHEDFGKQFGEIIEDHWVKWVIRWVDALKASFPLIRRKLTKVLPR